jgi:hypothetical protein
MMELLWGFCLVHEIGVLMKGCQLLEPECEWLDKG